MTLRMEHRFEVTFMTTEAPDGRPVVALLLNQEGQAAAGLDHTFFLDIDPAIAREAAPRLAELLNEYVIGFGVMLPRHDEVQNQSQPEHQSETSTLQTGVLSDDALDPEEPEPNSDEESQPRLPEEIDGFVERESLKGGDDRL
jgi:hypothetical protein